MCGCGCNNCGGCGSLCSACASQIVYTFERFTQCCAMTAVVTCFILTYLVTLGIGVGLGYNYCFVDFKSHRVPDSPDLDVDDTIFRRFGEQPPMENPTYPRVRITREAATEDYPLRATMIVPIWSRANLSEVLQKIRRSKKNVTLEILST